MLEQSTEKQGIFDRRMGRLSFFLWNFAGVVVLQILEFFMGLFDRPGMPPMGSGQVLFFMILLGIVIFLGVLITIQRLNDLQRSRWMALLALVPLANVVFFFWCCFAKGVQAAES